MIELNRDMDVKMKSGREEISLERPKAHIRQQIVVLKNTKGTQRKAVR
ncbi:hypothetical protein [Clostridium neonatale]|uniref:Uncharacterized protein n=1 Tax=Clostridium neonatale TaxID=137838 RepID=A0AA86JPF0_9CLOT|nr:hypothetical protein CNEO_60082 [Clostridium neonatale]